jgi:hypothetical protein
MASESVAFFEGRYMPLREAKISIVDPAITNSDIVFDVVSATGRVFFRLDDHVHRHFERALSGRRNNHLQARMQVRLRRHRLEATRLTLPLWLKVKNPAAPAVKREAEEDWAEKRSSRGRRIW